MKAMAESQLAVAKALEGITQTLAFLKTPAAAPAPIAKGMPPAGDIPQVNVVPADPVVAAMAQGDLAKAIGAAGGIAESPDTMRKAMAEVNIKVAAAVDASLSSMFAGRLNTPFTIDVPVAGVGNPQ
jgi:hypothetical protein